MYRGAFPKVVCASLETQAEYADSLALRRQHRRDSALEVGLIARQDRAQQRQIQIKLLCAVRECTNVLREAGSAEGESRVQISLGDIKLFVGREDVGHRACIDFELTAEGSDFICKSNLQSVESVAHVLDHFGSLYAGSNERCIELFIKLGEKTSAGSVQLADDGLRRVEKVRDRASLPQKLRIDGDSERLTRATVRGLLEPRDDDLLAGARQSGRADDDLVAVPRAAT